MTVSTPCPERTTHARRFITATTPKMAAEMPELRDLVDARDRTRRPPSPGVRSVRESSHPTVEALGLADRGRLTRIDQEVLTGA